MHLLTPPHFNSAGIGSSGALFGVWGFVGKGDRENLNLAFSFVDLKVKGEMLFLHIATGIATGIGSGSDSGSPAETFHPLTAASSRSTKGKRIQIPPLLPRNTAHPFITP